MQRVILPHNIPIGSIGFLDKTQASNSVNNVNPIQNCVTKGLVKGFTFVPYQNILIII